MGGIKKESYLPALIYNGCYLGKDDDNNIIVGKKGVAEITFVENDESSTVIMSVGGDVITETVDDILDSQGYFVRDSMEVAFNIAWAKANIIDEQLENAYMIMREYQKGRIGKMGYRKNWIMSYDIDKQARRIQASMPDWWDDEYQYLVDGGAMLAPGIHELTFVESQYGDDGWCAWDDDDEYCLLIFEELGDFYWMLVDWEFIVDGGGRPMAEASSEFATLGQAVMDFMSTEYRNYFTSLGAVKLSNFYAKRRKTSKFGVWQWDDWTRDIPTLICDPIDNHGVYFAELIPSWPNDVNDRGEYEWDGSFDPETEATNWALEIYDTEFGEEDWTEVYGTAREAMEEADDFIAKFITRENLVGNGPYTLASRNKTAEITWSEASDVLEECVDKAVEYFEDMVSGGEDVDDAVSEAVYSAIDDTCMYYTDQLAMIWACGALEDAFGAAIEKISDEVYTEFYQKIDPEDYRERGASQG